MKKYATVYRNAAQTPREKIVRVHRSEEACERYVITQRRAIAMDGYSHTYYGVLCEDPIRGEAPEGVSKIGELDFDRFRLIWYNADSGEYPSCREMDLPRCPDCGEPAGYCGCGHF
jgi:hypothetical protein